MPDTRAAVNVRERAEIERSDSEAVHTPRLRMPEEQVRRYLAPPSDTGYALEYAYHVLGDVRNRRVLDFGCGSGANTVLLALRGARVVGLDISQSLLRLARQRVAIHELPPQSFCAASAHQVPLADASVDVVFGIAVLHHLDLALAAGEIRRVLKEGGRAIFQEPVRESRVYRTLRPLLGWRDEDISPYEHPLTSAELRGLGDRFSGMRVRAFGLPHVQLAERLARNGRSIARRWYRSDRWILDRIPALRRYAATRVIVLTK